MVEKKSKKKEETENKGNSPKISVDFRKAMYDACLQMELPIVSEEHCAIICAMLVVHGNHEMFTHNHRLVTELAYAQKRFRVEGGESPDPHFAMLLKGYINGLELYYEREHDVPDYINDFFEERYSFRFNIGPDKKK